MSTTTAFFKWFLLGCFAASALLWAQSASVGGPAGLLQVGETSNLRQLIEGELGEIPLAAGPGHDGQIYYAIGLDLGGAEVPELLDHGAYRYRRILYPAVSAVFGVFDGYALLWSMIVVVVLSTGIAAGGVAAIAARYGFSDWLALVVLLNPGMWLSVRLLTADALAMAAMVLALGAVLTIRASSAPLFALSVLSKDVYLATPAGLAVSREKRRWVDLAIATIPLLVWMAWLTFSFGEGFTPRGNLALPITGIIEGSRNWAHFDLAEWVYLGFSLLSVGAGLVFALTRRSRLRWSILLWCLLALISSNWVWDFGNNAARAFAPIVVLIGVALATQTATGSSRLAAVAESGT